MVIFRKLIIISTTLGLRFTGDSGHGLNGLHGKSGFYEPFFFSFLLDASYGPPHQVYLVLVNRSPSVFLTRPPNYNALTCVKVWIGVFWNKKDRASHFFPHINTFLRRCGQIRDHASVLKTVCKCIITLNW